MNEADIEQDPEIIHKLKESPQKLLLSRDFAFHFIETVSSKATCPTSNT